MREIPTTYLPACRRRLWLSYISRFGHDRAILTHAAEVRGNYGRLWRWRPFDKTGRGRGTALALNTPSESHFGDRSCVCCEGEGEHFVCGLRNSQNDLHVRPSLRWCRSVKYAVSSMNCDCVSVTAC